LLILTLLALEPVRRVFWGSTAEISAQVVSADDRFIVIAFSNFGIGPGFLTDLYITAEPSGDGSWSTVISFPGLPEPMIRPGETKVIRLEHKNKIPRVAVPGEVDQGQLRRCNFVYQYTSGASEVYIQKSAFYRCDRTHMQKADR
jgi:hypothetical protein